MITSRGERTLNYVVALLFATASIAPLVGVLLAALHPPGALLSGISLPETLSLDTFAAAWERGSFTTLMTSSLVVSMAVVVLTTVTSIPAGYAFGVIRFPLSNVLFYVLIAGIIIPFEAVIVPLYYAFRGLGLTNTYWALILPQAGLQVCFGTFWMRAFFRAAPIELIEAARIDGATTWQILWRACGIMYTPLVSLLIPAIIPLPRARGIDQYPPKLTPQRKILARIACGHHVANAQMLQIMCQHEEPLGGWFIGHDDALVAHQLRHMRGLAARRGAQVTD